MARLLYRLLVALARLAVRSGRSKDLEIIVLRHQLAVLHRQNPRPAITNNDRVFLAAIASALSRQRRARWIVTPDTLLRWHRQRITRHWTQPQRPRGRPPTRSTTRQLVVRLATDNPTWGYRRVHGELMRLGHRVAPSTVWQILHDHGVDPSPERATVTWTEFLKSQAAVACDFFTIDTVTMRRYYVLFFIDIPTRHVTYAGLTPNPTAAWTVQAARNLFLRHADRFAGARAIVHDRGCQFTDVFDEIFRTEGIKPLRTPPRVPVANAFAERWVRTIRRELLDRAPHLEQPTT